MPTLSVTVDASIVKLIGAAAKAYDPINPTRGYGQITEWWTDGNGVRWYKITFTW